MAVLRVWWLPVVLGVGQLLAWPGYPLATGERPAPVMVAVAVVVTLVLVGALGWRRRAPVAALGVVVLGLVAGTLVLPTGTLTFIAFTDAIALFSVAVWRPARDAAIAVAVVLIAQIVLEASTLAAREAAVILPFVALEYILIAALGQLRGRWHQGRAAAAARLAVAEADRRRAAHAERDRLARELHDVTAHHLTAIVVHAGAARRLGTDRPDLLAQALDFAADTGRRTLTALHSLVAIVDPTAAAPGPVTEPLAVRLDRLASAAGGTVRLELAGSIAAVPPPLGDVVYAVVREAVTNAMRYAPGAAVTVSLAQPAGEVLLTVDNTRADTAEVERLGSGRGLAGLQARVDELGGTFEAGPDPVGGWRVHAVLPMPAQRRPSAQGVSVEHVVDAIAVVGVLLPALLVLFLDRDLAVAQALREPQNAVLLTLLLVLHAAPLWWWRRALWRTLFAVLAAAFAYAVIAASTSLPADSMVALGMGVGAEFVALYVVAAYARPAMATWAAILAVAGTWAIVVVGATALRDEMLAAPSRYPLVSFVWMLVSTAGVFAVLCLPVWGLATVLRTRRRRTLRAERMALAAAARQALAAARDQRARFAAGLHASVLEPAARLIAAADEGRAVGADGLAAIDRVAAEARAGLAAMRELLGVLGPEATGGSAPPHGTADLPELCAARSVDGRSVTLTAPPVPGPLPVAVDLSGYRIVDAALDSDDGGTVSVDVEYADEALAVTMTGIPSATDGTIAARIRARVAVLGGTVRFDPAGVVAVRLPAHADGVAVGPHARRGEASRADKRPDSKEASSSSSA
jgi:signal transduction histidine kinase